MGASIVLHNIIHPTFDNDTQFRSVDLQVNGFGFYRTVANGAIGLLHSRIKFTNNPSHSVHHPYDTMTLPGDAIYFQPFFISKADYQFDVTFNGDKSFAFTTGADRAAILGGDDTTTQFAFEGLAYMPTRTLSETAGTYATFDWELDTTVDRSTNSAAWGTFPWEGMNTYYLTGTSNPFTINQSSRQANVSFKFFDFIHLSPNTVPWQVSADFANNDALMPLSTNDQVMTTQNWEIWDPNYLELQSGEVGGGAEFSPLNSKFLFEREGARNGEDASGRHATYRWEIDQLDITQTSFWSWHDIKADSALGAPVELDNDPPLAGNQLSIFQEHAFLSGDPDNPHHLRWSKRFRPESHPPENYIEVGTANNSIVTHVPIAGVLGVFTNETKYRVDGNSSAGFVKDEAISHRGMASPRSAVATDHGVFFVARDGVHITNFISPDQKISDAIDPIFTGQTKNSYAPINWNAIEQIAGGYYKNRYYFSYPTGTSTVNNMTAIYYTDSQQWTFWDVGFGSFYAERDTNLFLAGGASDGIVRVIEESTAQDDIGTSLSFELQTQDFTGSTQTTRNLFTYFKVDAECSVDSMTAEFYVDDTLKQSHTITGSRTNQLLRLPENTVGHKWRIRVTYTGSKRVAVYGVQSIFIPLLAAA